MTTRPAELGDVEDLVRVHQRAFEGFFLTKLGPRFLRELYRGFVHEPSAICLVARDEKTVTGFVVGVLHPSSFFKGLLIRRWYAFTAAAIPSLIRHPMVVARKLLSALFYRGAEPAGQPGGSLLSSLAVAPEASGKGIGSLLVRGFCDHAQRHGSKFVYLTTDRDNNEAVNRFYQRVGFQLESSYESHRRWMNLYAKYFN